MNALRIFGLLAIVYAVVCVVFNFFFHLELGIVGSFLFNPLGVLFANQIASAIIGLSPIPIIGGLLESNIAWMVGGLIAAVWSLGCFFVGLILAKR
jgi:hypothetical protein